MTDESDPEELLQQSKEQRRTSTEASTDPSADDPSPSLPDAVATALDDIDAGEMNSTFGFRDERLVALLDGLERSGDLPDVVADAQAALGRDVDPDNSSRSEAGRLLIRLGLQSLDESILEDAREGYEKHLTRQADEF